MKSFAVILATFVAVVTSDATLPSCAQSCVTQYTTGSSIADCNSLDIACICASEEFLDGISCCLESSCDTADQQSAIEYAQEICSTAGVTVPSALTCSTSNSTSNSTSTSSSTSSASSTAASSTASTSSNAGVNGGSNMALSLVGSVGGLAAIFAML